MWSIFMTSLLFNCAPTVIENETTMAWTDKDQAQVEHSQKRCQEIFPYSPCLKKFWKIGIRRYKAQCGPETKPYGEGIDDPKP